MQWNFISIEKSKRKNILENKIDVQDYFGLKGDRTRLITLGISLGLEHPEDIITRDSLYRPEYINSNPELKAIMIASVVNSLDNYDNLDTKLSDKNITDLTDKYLNRGIDIIEDRIDNEPETNRIIRRINELDILYKTNVGQ